MSLTLGGAAIPRASQPRLVYWQAMRAGLVALTLAAALVSCGFDKSAFSAGVDGGVAADPDGGGTQCASGLQDNDSNGTCVASCATAVAEGLSCGTGTCADTGGQAACVCEPGLSGPTCGVGPSSCADLLAIDAASTDGTFTLYFDGDGSKPWTAYCADMAGMPALYAQLTMTGPDQNFSQYTAGGSSPGTDVRTNYTRVRIDPSTYLIDISDQRFSSSAGALTHSGNEDVSSMPYGVAMSCDSGPSGVANINLQGTPFAVDNAFCQAGYQAEGSVTFSDSDQVVTIAGGGGCGWTAPAPCPFNPYNSTGGSILSLTYAP